MAGKWSKARQKPRDLAYNARTSPDMWSDERGKALNAAVQSLDQVARAMEQKWGYGTLERLASPDLPQSFTEQKKICRQPVMAMTTTLLSRSARTWQRAGGCSIGKQQKQAVSR